ncbi:hotdog fold thioesterase [Brachybacterium sp. JHP9]|uniref:Hotdog fold thioesterase n=1 Tax=Brachybacterium equifaecis TaxID=2910770 RepID=A0ABT0R0F9_9MICO|nr:hotdog fold thioesterase [Brachybacterium equifaecis]MCL6423397.1 hotdog fold thioesterase [Brachybacterium equifaecis]
MDHDAALPGTDDRLRALRAALEGTLSARMGMELEELAPEGGAMTMPVEGNLQPAGLLHGGATISLAETVASMAAILQARAVHGEGAAAVGTTVSAVHHRSARSGRVRATCTARQLGRQVAAYLVEVHDEQGTLISTIQVTTQLLPPR